MPIDLKKLQLICIWFLVIERLFWNIILLCETQMTFMYSSAWFYFIQCLISSSFIDHHCLLYVPFLIQFHQRLTKLFQSIHQPRYLSLLVSTLTTKAHSLTLPPWAHTQHIFIKGANDPLKFGIIWEIEKNYLKLGTEKKWGD